MKHQFISGQDIIMFSFQSWDSAIGSNFIDMAVELSRNNRVLFVNRALDRISLFRDRKNEATRQRLNSVKTGKGELEQVRPNIWVHNPRVVLESINSIPFASLHDRLNKWNTKRLAKQIRKAAEKLGFDRAILINDNDFIRGFYLKELLPVSSYIFYIRDYMLGVKFFKRHGPRLERGLLRKVDMVVANSDYLAAYARRVNPSSYYIGQGCDFSPFIREDYPVPQDLLGIRRPIIGYTGFISAWRIDSSIIGHIAEQCPGYNIVLVGPVDWMFRKASLEQFTNIHFLGPRHPDQLASYIQQFDVCINPQIKNDITMGNYPRKADEYLAMGKPLVATDTEGMKMFGPYSFLCNSQQEYVEKIKYIIDQPELANSDAIIRERKAFAMSHTWEESIGLLGDAYHHFKLKGMNHG